MTFTEWMQAHRRSILFLLGLLVCGGIFSAWRLPVALFPQVNFPRVRVDLDAGDRPADQMVIAVTKPVEQAVRSVPGVVSIKSTTTRGSASISIRFDWGENMLDKLLQVESAINQIIPSLPPGTSFQARRMDPTVFPVLAYSMTSDTHSLVQLRNIALYQLRPLFSTVKGVAKVGVQGGDREEYRVTVDPAQLASYNLSLADISKALSATNVLTTVGRIQDHYKLYLVVSDTRLHSLESIRHTVLRSGKDGVVLLDDVATVSKTPAPRWTRVVADGHRAVIVQIYQQPGGNTVQIDRHLKAKLAAYRHRLPKGIHIASWYDQSQLILASAASVRDAIFIGVLLAALVLLVFLRNLKVTLIAIISVPSVLAATILLLYVLHMSFNIMTLGGMAAAVGLIIDDTIVMVEHIIRRLRGSGSNHHQQVLHAAREFTKPLVGSSASTIIIFLPLAFLSGVTGAFFKSLSLTMAASLFVSFLIALLADPLLADHFLSRKDAEQQEGGAITAMVHRGYTALMERLLARPWLVLLIVVPLGLSGWFSYRHVGSGFMPSMDEGGFILDYRAAPGTSLSETNRLLDQVGAILDSTPAVQTYSRRTGLALGGTLSEPNNGDYFVRLKPFPRPSIWQVMDQVRARIKQTVPGLHFDMAQLMQDLIGDLTAGPQPIEIKIYSDNGSLLSRLGPRVAAAIRKIPGVVEVDDGIVMAGDALEIKINRVKAALQGVDPESVTKTLKEVLTGVVTTHVQHGERMIGVRVWVPQAVRKTEWDLKHLQLRAPDGHLFPIDRIATVKVVTGQPEIDRDNLKRMIAVTGRINGRDMGSVIRQVKKVLKRPGLLPKGIYYSLGGLYKEQQIAFAGLLLVFISAVLLVFLLLLFLYESFRVALSILLTTLTATSAVFIGLWLSGTQLNISSIMGMTMIVGIATEVGIFYVSEYYDLPLTPHPAATLINAGKNRLRPIAMTTLAAILALLPLALGIGQGSAMQQPLAIAIISGLIVQFPLVLILLPVLLSVLRHRKTSEERSE